MPTKSAKKVKGVAKAKTKKGATKKALKKPVLKAKAAAKGKGKAAPKGKAKAKPKLKLVKSKAAPKESFFDRLLREKRERQEKAQAQRSEQSSQFGHQQSRLPLAHVKFSKFAGPRRRAA